MGLTNAECQRRWRAKHKAESLTHIERLRRARPAHKHQSGYGNWSSGTNGVEGNHSGADDAASTYHEPTKIDHQYGTARVTAANPYQVSQPARTTTANPYQVPQLPRTITAYPYQVHQPPRTITATLYQATQPARNGVRKTTTERSPEKREKDALRFLALCDNQPTAFRSVIDTLPDSSIKRICDVVLNATKGDVRQMLTPEQRRLCEKYKRSIAILLDKKKSLEVKRSLLRSMNKQAGGSVFVPPMINATLDMFGTELIPTSI
jgi:hypothetical protein